MRSPQFGSPTSASPAPPWYRSSTLANLIDAGGALAGQGLGCPSVVALQRLVKTCGTAVLEDTCIATLPMKARFRRF